MRTRVAGRTSFAPLLALLLALLIAPFIPGTAGEWTSNPNLQAAPQHQLDRAPSDLRTLKLPPVPYRYAGIEMLPIHFRQGDAQRFDNTPPDNPITDAGATLGRVLFYDTRLSANNTVSCGSCHVQKAGFADPKRFSRGFEGGTTDRHAMNLVNLRYHPRGRFFWDERGGNLESMVLMPVENHLEMGQDLKQLPKVHCARRALSRAVPQRLRRSGRHQRAHLPRAGAVRSLAGVVSVEIRRGSRGGELVEGRLRELHAAGESGQGALRCATVRCVTCRIRTRTSS